MNNTESIVEAINSLTETLDYLSGWIVFAIIIWLIGLFFGIGNSKNCCKE